MNREENGIEINLMQIVDKLLENAKYIIVIMILFAILGFAGSSLFITPMYEASAKMIVNSRRDESVNVTKDQLNSSRDLVDTYAVIICGRDVVNSVIDDLGLEESYDAVSKAINVSSVNNTPIMQIRVKHADREVALLIVEKLLEIAPDMLVHTTEVGSVKPVDQAYAAFEPVSPNIMKNTIFAAFLGFALSCFVVLIFVLMDNTYKTDIDIQKDLNLPVLGVLPAVESCRGYVAQKVEEKQEGNENG